MDEETITMVRAAMVAYGMKETDIAAIMRLVVHIRRGKSGSEFMTILDDYYERVDRGERVKLAELARAAGVNHASLRQYKVRYDAAYRKDKANGMRRDRIT